jgi:glutaredoxin-related protein
VYVKGVHVGGNDDTQAAAKSGTLQQMLNWREENIENIIATS